MLTEKIYLSPHYNSVEELEKDLEWYWSGSRFDSYMHCYRRGMVQYDKKLEPKVDDTLNLDVGTALHAALAVYYAYGGKKGGSVGRDMALQALLMTLEERGGLPILPPDDKNAHITPGHLQIILKNYFKWAEAHDSIEPVTVTEDQLNLENVLGARFKYTPEGKIVLGESAIIMRLTVQPPWEPFGSTIQYTYAGVPDLPVTMHGSVYVMDHKSTGWNLSSYWASKWRVDNTLRVYCVMIRELLSQLNLNMRGILINAIHTGKQAARPGSKAKKFERYGPWNFDPGALKEALWNHAAALLTREYYQTALGGYFPQSTGLYCPGCPAKHLCHQDPKMRPGVEVVNYRPKKHRHLLEVKNDSGE